MSGALSARIKPKTKWPVSFKGSLRDRLSKRYRDTITPDALSYLEGLRDNESDNDYRDALDEIIGWLEEGHEVELKLEY